MAPQQSKWLRWLAGLVAALLLGGAIWYAHGRGWLESAFTRLRQSVLKGEAAKSDAEEMEDMPGMPGMKMPKGQKKTEAASGVPGHAEVMIPAEIQQRIGVTVGQVVKSPHRMSVDTVGIVGLNEPKVSHVHLR